MANYLDANPEDTPMPTDATRVNASALSLVRDARHSPGAHDAISWPVACGRTVADAAAMLFPLPLADELLALFHDAIRQEVAAEMMQANAVDNLSTASAAALLAFERRLAEHTSCPPPQGGQGGSGAA